jgi:EmrB/QacA subfamily drug resistance transporter
MLQTGSTRGRWVILSTVLGSGMAAIDATVVGIALPSIGREYHAPLGQLQWVVTGYALSLSAFLLLGGSLGDRAGRRRIYCIGVVWFTAASALCALAPNPVFLVVMRLLQGVGGALLTPGSLAIIQASFGRDDRGRAIGAWSGFSGLATAAGPLLGGYLVSASSWRWIFLMNLPLGAAVLAISVRHVPESKDPSARRGLDLAGVLLGTGALAGLTFGLIEGPSQGWSTPQVLATLTLGVLAAGAFLFVETKSPSPILPLTVFRSRQFSVTNAVTFIIYAALGGALFLLPIELQVVDGFTPLASGAALLPLTVIMLALSAGSGRLATLIGPRPQMSLGPIVVGTGLALLARTVTDHSYVTGVLPAVVVFGFGLAITVPPLTATALSSVAEQHAGLASAVNNDVARIGGLIAVAVLPPLAGISGDAYLHPAALAAGFRTAVLVAGTATGAAGLLSAVGIRKSPGASPTVGAVSTSECLHCALDATPMLAEARGAG